MTRGITPSASRYSAGSGRPHRDERSFYPDRVLPPPPHTPPAARTVRATRRTVIGALGLAAAAPALAACRPLFPDREPEPFHPKVSGQAYQLRPVDEALWVCGEDGVLWALDGRTDTVSARVPLDMALPKLSVPVLHAGPVLWAYEFQIGAVVAVDPAAARIIGRAAVPPAKNLLGLASTAAHGALWIAQHDTLFRVGPDARSSHTALPSGLSPAALAATANALWIAGHDQLVRIDLAGPGAVRSVPLPPGASVGDLTAGTHSLYALSADRTRLWILNADTGEVLSALVFDEAVSALYPVAEDLWVAGDRTLRRVREGKADPPITSLTDGSFVDSSDLFQGAIWAAATDRCEVDRTDLATGRVTATVAVEVAELEDPSFGVYAGKRALWVLDGDFYNGISRIDPQTATARKVVPTTGIESQYAVAAEPPAHPSPA